MDIVKDFLKKVKPTYDDNAIDRLHYVYTCLVTFLLALTIGMYQFGGKPLTCWTPKEFTKYWNQYVRDFCFVENTYFLPWSTGVPEEVHRRDEKEFFYYQWVPFILALEAFMFYVPHIIWTSLNKMSGINIERIVSMARETKSIDYKNRKKNEAVIASHMRLTLYLNQHMKEGQRFISIVRCGKNQGIYCTVLYLVVKLLYLANVIGQYAILNGILTPGYTLWGFGVMNDLARGRDWQASGHFPRTTLCDFEIRRLGNINRMTLQCVIWINMLNEKIFLFLWYWFFFLTIFTFLDVCYWFTVSLYPGLNRSFIMKFLRVKRLITSNADDEKARKFLSNLRPDGILICRLLAQNAGELITSDIIETMWNTQFEKKNDDENPPQSPATAPEPPEEKPGGKPPAYEPKKGTAMVFYGT